MSTAIRVTDHMDMIQQLAKVLTDHPDGNAFRLMFAPAGITIGEDEVLVQHTDPETRSIVLRPCKIAEVEAADVLYIDQPIADKPFTEHRMSDHRYSAVYGMPMGCRHLYLA
jgi:hypothetical protein